jgi:hypothetical protein
MGIGRIGAVIAVAMVMVMIIAIAKAIMIDTE